MDKIFFYGYFDPITTVELETIIKFLQKKRKQGIIAVAENHSDDLSTMFSAQKRAEMIKECLIFNDKLAGTQYAAEIQVVIYDGSAVKAAKKYGATVMAYCCSNSSTDAAYAQELLTYNDAVIRANGCADKLVQEIVKYSDKGTLSSHSLKMLGNQKEYVALGEFVLPPVYEALLERYLRKIYEDNVYFNESKLYWQQFTDNFKGRSFFHLGYVVNMLHQLMVYGGEVENKRWMISAIFFNKYSLGENGREKSFQASGLPKEARGLFFALEKDNQALKGDEILMQGLEYGAIFLPLQEPYAPCARWDFSELSDEEYEAARKAFFDKTLEKLPLPGVCKSFNTYLRSRISTPAE